MNDGDPEIRESGLELHGRGRADRRRALQRLPTLTRPLYDYPERRGEHAAKEVLLKALSKVESEVKNVLQQEAGIMEAYREYGVLWPIGEDAQCMCGHPPRHVRRARGKAGVGLQP